MPNSEEKKSVSEVYKELMKKDASFNVGAKSDICMMLEGTYPFVRGGVSSWVHQIISNMPQYTFYLVFIGGQRSAT